MILCCLVAVIQDDGDECDGAWRCLVFILILCVDLEKNIAPDVFSRAWCSSECGDTSPVFKLHASLCHPGVIRMYDFVKSRNLPYSVVDIRQMTHAGRDC